VELVVNRFDDDDLKNPFANLLVDKNKGESKTHLLENQVIQTKLKICSTTRFLTLMEVGFFFGMNPVSLQKVNHKVKKFFNMLWNSVAYVVSKKPYQINHQRVKEIRNTGA